jgi:hypothetical protein
MPKRTWLGELALALIAATVLIFMAGTVGALLLEQYAKRHQTYADYQQNAESDRRAASNKVAEACQDRSAPAFRACIADQLEAYYRDQATNQDLQAQQDMAYWAGALFVSSTILTLIGIFLLWRTLLATQQTLAESQKATEAAQAAVSVTRQIGMVQSRAYLTVETIRFRNVEIGKQIAFDLKLKNFGQTPAKKVKAICRCLDGFGESQGHVSFQGPRSAQSLRSQPDVSPSGPIALAATSRVHVTPEILAQINAGELNIIGVAIVTYKDIFGIRRRTLVKVQMLTSDIPDQPGVRLGYACRTGNKTS